MDTSSGASIDVDTPMTEGVGRSSAPPAHRTGVLNVLRALRDDGPQDRIPAVLEEHYLEAWFGFAPHELRSVLNAAPDPEVHRRPLVAYTRSLLRGEAVPPMADARQSDLKALSSAARGTVIAIGVLEARLGGEFDSAMQLVNRAAADAPVSNALVDGSLGIASFTFLQAGITRMLAGDLGRALADFERVKWTVPPADLAFLVRDAHAKAALVHAMFGDPELVHRELAEAQRVPRTQSWAEVLVDATAKLATLIADGSEAAFTQLLSLPRQEIGEMWPLFVLSLAPAVLAGRSGAERLLVALENAPLPGSTTGQGMTGSASAVVRAAQAASAGRLSEARAVLASADPELVVTRLVQAGLALDGGMPSQALALALRTAEQTGGLRQLELWRLGVLHLAHRALGEDAAADAALEQARRCAEGLSRVNLPISGASRALVEAVLRDETSPAPAAATLSLTPRELEVLAHLAAGVSRRGIAERLFVSVNTIKSQVSSLYRKLDAADRDEMLAEAYRRGLI